MIGRLLRATLALALLASIVVAATGNAHRLAGRAKEELRHLVHQARGTVDAASLPQFPSDPLLVGPTAGQQPRGFHTTLVIQSGDTAPGWQDWSWGTHALKASGPGGKRAVQGTLGAWAALSFHATTPLQAWGGSVDLLVHGGAQGGQQIGLVLVDGGGHWGTRVPLLEKGIPAGAWTALHIPLSASLGAGSTIGGVILQESSGTPAAAFFVADLALHVAGLQDYPAAHTTLALSVDAGRDRRPISPYIYGLAGTDGDAYGRTVRPTLLRWGGNPSSRFNWRIGHAWNSARDYLYLNGDYGVHSGSASDQAVVGNAKAGIATWLTIPTLGWVAKDTSSFSFPGPDGKATDGGGASCSKPGATADPTRTSIRVGPSFMQDWVRHLQQDLHQRVQFFSMDNEPDIWGTTHYDVHPTCTGYDEILREFTSYASAIKDVAPASQVTGPASCCWYYYWHSMQGDADRARHGNQDLLPWFLQQVRAYDARHQRRTLDVLDVHYYPEGVYNDNVDAATAAWRLQETRSLWDATYTDHSWIGQPVRLIPRLAALIARDYPGTRLGIGEWNFGADGSLNGGLAIADVLGIFGQQGLAMAAYWRYPAAGSPGAAAFQLYRNYDGQGASFGETSVRAASSNRDRVAVYGSLRARDGHLVLVVVNKMPNTEAVASLHIAGFAAASTHAYRYDGQHAAIADLGRQRTDNLRLPPYSMTVLDIAGKLSR